MKQIFFQKGISCQFCPFNQHLIQTSNNLDSKKYVLHRVQSQQFNSQQNYIQNNFFLKKDTNLISYLSCWQQLQQVLSIKNITTIQKISTNHNIKQKKKQKKKMIDIATKRKSKIQIESMSIIGIGGSKLNINGNGNANTNIINNNNNNNNNNSNNNSNKISQKQINFTSVNEYPLTSTSKSILNMANNNINTNHESSLVLQQIYYIQLQYFSEYQLHLLTDFTLSRDFIIIVYLLAMKIKNRLGFLPCFIPVKGDQNDKIKFYRKADKNSNIQIELCRLMKYVFRQKQQDYLLKWDENLAKQIHKADINKDQLLVGALIKNAIQSYLQQSFPLSLINEQQRVWVLEQVYIRDYSMLYLGTSQIEVPLEQCKIEYLLKSEHQREIILSHDLFQEYVLFGKKGNIVVKWLYQMST